MAETVPARFDRIEFFIFHRFQHADFLARRDGLATLTAMVTITPGMGAMMARALSTAARLAWQVLPGEWRGWQWRGRWRWCWRGDGGRLGGVGVSLWPDFKRLAAHRRDHGACGDIFDFYVVDLVVNFNFHFHRREPRDFLASWF